MKAEFDRLAATRGSAAARRAVAEADAAVATFDREKAKPDATSAVYAASGEIRRLRSSMSAVWKENAMTAAACMPGSPEARAEADEASKALSRDLVNMGGSNGRPG